ncbi:MAG: hypothetical protein JNK05_26905 [Myxococcales bacterium]|nr:hypothetical protein [Myxococcales bacterium]
MRERPRFTVEMHVGRLLEARVYSLKTAQDVAEYGAAIAEHVARASSGTKLVLCADHRPVMVYPPSAADGLVAMFERNNAALERAGLVLDPANATLLLQLERIVREAAYERRKVFRDSESVVTFLSDVLDPRETARAREFLAGFVAGRGPDRR